MNILLQKLKEAALSVLAIVVLVLILNFTAAPLEPYQLFRFLIGALFIVCGLAVFLLGVELSIDQIGHHLGASLAKTGRIWIVAVAGIVLGFFVSIAEPDLQILAEQVDMVTSGTVSKLGIMLVVSLGAAILLAFGLVRIVYNVPLNRILIVLYLIILGLALFTSPEFLAISFDASGATTGTLTVPFILALSVGVSALKKNSKASEKDSFGLMAITSTGAIIAVMIMHIIHKSDVTGSLDDASNGSTSVFLPFVKEVPGVALDVVVALLPILVLFAVFQRVSFHLSKQQVGRILIGLLYSFLGLVLFLTGVNAGFMEVGTLVGYKIAKLDNRVLLICIGFIMGIVTLLAEPAVYVLTNQIENVTSGYVRRRTVLAALALGVGLSVALSMVRILVPSLKLWHYLLPGYAIALLLTFIVPKLFVGIAFDSGGVASGSMTGTFILAFAQGAADAVDGANVLLDGFGIISMVAMTPIITLQILGLIYKIKSRKRGVVRAEKS